MSRSVHGHKHIGRAKCSACSGIRLRDQQEQRSRITQTESTNEAFSGCDSSCCPQATAIEILMDYEEQLAVESCECDEDFVCSYCCARGDGQPLRVKLIEAL